MDDLNRTAWTGFQWCSVGGLPIVSLRCVVPYWFSAHCDVKIHFYWGNQTSDEKLERNKTQSLKSELMDAGSLFFWCVTFGIFMFSWVVHQREGQTTFSLNRWDIVFRISLEVGWMDGLIMDGWVHVCEFESFFEKCGLKLLVDLRSWWRDVNKEMYWKFYTCFVSG